MGKISELKTVKPLEIVGNSITQDKKTAMGHSTFEYAAVKEWKDLPLKNCVLVKR